MGRHVGYGYCLSGCQRHQFSCFGHSFGSGIGNKCGLMGFFQSDLSPYPCLGEFDGFSGPYNGWIGLCKQGQYVFHALGGPFCQ